MPSLAQKLSEAVLCGKATLLCERTSELYPEFLSLYANVGYRPKDERHWRAWEARTVGIWQEQDRLLPGNCTGGVRRGAIISSVGVLPLSPRVIYAHSLCMRKTLFGVVTAFSQCVHSVKWLDRLPGIQFFSGSYARRSSFTSKLQRSAEIPGQFELDAVRYENIEPPASVKGYSISDVTESDIGQLRGNVLRLYDLVREPHPALSGSHRVTSATILDKDRRPAAIVLKSEAPAEFTAANVFSWTWVLPCNAGMKLADLRNVVRSFPLIGAGRMRIVLAGEADASDVEIAGERAIPEFWAFAPRASSAMLIESFAAAFGGVFELYAAHRPRSVYEMLECLES